MSFGNNPLRGRAEVTAAGGLAVIIPAVPEPIEITLILAPGGDVNIFHARQEETVYSSANLILAPGPGNVVFQSQHAGSGITLEKGDSIAVLSSTSTTVSIYAAIAVTPEEAF